jgi:hypothetical protein
MCENGELCSGFLGGGVLDVKFHEGVHGGLGGVFLVEEEDDCSVLAVGEVVEVLDSGECLRVVDVF